MFAAVVGEEVHDVVVFAAVVGEEVHDVVVFAAVVGEEVHDVVVFAAVVGEEVHDVVVFAAVVGEEVHDVVVFAAVVGEEVHDVVVFAAVVGEEVHDVVALVAVLGELGQYRVVLVGRNNAEVVPPAVCDIDERPRVPGVHLAAPPRVDVLTGSRQGRDISRGEEDIPKTLDRRGPGVDASGRGAPRRSSLPRPLAPPLS